jgi:hypothetical protein
MTERERVLAEKKASIQDIAKKQKCLIIRSARLMKKPYMKPEILFARMAKIMAMIFQIRCLEAQKQIVINQPLPKEGPAPSFAPGSCGPKIIGVAIVGENGTEVITKSDGKIISSHVTGSQHDAFLDLQKRMNELKF